MLTQEEKEYIIELLEESKRSLEDVCDENHIPIVDFITEQKAKDEFELIDTIMEKLR